MTEKFNRIEHPADAEMHRIKKMIKNGQLPQFKTFDDFMQRCFIAAIISKKDAAIIDTAFAAERHVHRTGIHYFIDSEELYYWLMNTHIKDLNALVNSLEVTEDEVVGVMQRSDGNHSYGIFGYIHAKINSPAIQFAINFTKDKKHFSIVTEISDDYYTSGDFSIFSQKHLDEYKKDNVDIVVKNTRLVLNLFLYRRAFSECIINGAPKGQVMEYIDKKSMIIKTSPVIQDGSGVTPHFRSGHFRLLKSDFYKKQHGKIVFVRSTFVKGSAKTVENSQDKDQMA